MSFIPPMDDWVRSHYVDVPNQTVTAIGDLTGKRILEVGCGEPLAAFGLLNKGARQVVGLDVKVLPDSFAENTLQRIEAAGFPEARSHIGDLELRTYDGISIPFADDDFDVVFSWGVFEHVSDVKSVLMEMKRVMKPDAIGFIKVFPWFQSFAGSHLSDFLEPFAHLKLSDTDLYAQLIQYLDAHPEAPRGLVLDHMWPEYLTLNKYSADMFYRDFQACGFSSHKWMPICHPQELSSAPSKYNFSELIICGLDVVFRK
jgi:SAM-dependent methyltransferase